MCIGVGGPSFLRSLSKDRVVVFGLQTKLGGRTPIEFSFIYNNADALKKLNHNNDETPRGISDGE
jgi:hypothetical protein